MSEMRRTARGLVEPRTEVFESRHPLEESKRRLGDALAKVDPGARAAFTPSWSGEPERPVLSARFAPSRRTRRLLQLMSVAMALLMAGSAWAWISDEAPRTLAFLLALATLLAILGAPLAILGMASQRQAAEARVLKAIRVALLDEDEKLPPRQRWEDED